LISEKA